MLQLVLLRGAETVLHDEGKVIGQLNPEPKQIGLPDDLVYSLESIFARVGVDDRAYFYSSPLKRTNVPAARLGFDVPQPVPLVTSSVRQELRERNFGEYQGRTYEDLGLTVEDLARQQVVPGGETRKAFRTRVNRFLSKELLPKDGLVVVTAHYYVINSMMDYIEGKREPQARHLPPSSGYAMEIDDLGLVQCVERLPRYRSPSAPVRAPVVPVAPVPIQP